jgi:hypothetical protein
VSRRSVHRPVELEEEPQSIEPERVRDEELRLEPRRFDALPLEEVARHADHFRGVPRRFGRHAAGD